MNKTFTQHFHDSAAKLNLIASSYEYSISKMPDYIMIAWQAKLSAERNIEYLTKASTEIAADPSYALRWNTEHMVNHAEDFRLSVQLIHEVVGIIEAQQEPKQVAHEVATYMAKRAQRMMLDMLGNRKELGYDDDRMAYLRAAQRSHLGLLRQSKSVQELLLEVTALDLLKAA